MSQNLQIDPVKRDYVVVNGSPIPTDRVLEATYYAVMIPKDKYLYGGPNQGSLIHTLAQNKRSGSVEENFSAYALDAINRQLISTGQVTKAEIKNLAVSREGTSNNIDVVPNQTQISNQFNFIAV